MNQYPTVLYAKPEETQQKLVVAPQGYTAYVPAPAPQAQQLLIPVQAAIQEEPIKKMSSASQIIEAEGLERPSESVEFAQYFHNHMGKTEKAKSALSKISKVTMVIALGSLFYVCFTLMSTLHLGAPAHTGHARLRATRENDGD